MNEFYTPPARIVALQSLGVDSHGRTILALNPGATPQNIGTVHDAPSDRAGYRDLSPNGSPGNPGQPVGSGRYEPSAGPGAAVVGVGYPALYQPGPVTAAPFERDFVSGSYRPGPAGCAQPLAVTPESYMGAPCEDPIASACDKSRVLPPWVTTAPPQAVQQVINDYNVVGSIGQLRKTFAALYGFGNFQNQRQPAVTVGNDQIATFVSPALSLGFRLDWSIQLLNYQSFDMQVQTAGWTTYPDDLSANRDFTARIGGAASGSIYVPWAVRPAGMSVAQNAIVGGLDPQVPGTISVLNIPAAILPNFSFQATILTAFHPITAAFGKALDLY